MVVIKIMNREKHWKISIIFQYIIVHIFKKNTHIKEIYSAIIERVCRYDGFVELCTVLEYIPLFIKLYVPIYAICNQQFINKTWNSQK